MELNELAREMYIAYSNTKRGYLSKWSRQAHWRMMGSSERACWLAAAEVAKQLLTEKKE